MMYYQLLERSARSILGMRVDLHDQIEDYVQETLLRYVCKASVLADHDNVEGWLFVTLRNLIMSDLRKEKNRRPAFSLDEEGVFWEPSDEVAGVEEQLITWEAMAQIREAAGEDNFRLLQQYYGEGAPLGALAKQVGVKENTLRVRLHRLKGKIRKRMGKSF